MALADDANAVAWDTYVAGHGSASLYHQYRWRGLIRDLFGHPSDYFMASDEAGRMVGVLPTVRLSSRLFGNFLVSMPYFNYGGVLADDPLATAALLERAAARARQLGVSHLELRHVRGQTQDWARRTDKVCMHLALPGDEEQLLKNIGSKLRAQVKRPLKEGAQVIHGGAELIPDFYAVFSRNMRDLGTPVYGRRLFERIAADWSSNTRLVVVRVGDKPVAAGFLLRWRDTMEVPWASSLREYNRYSVNMLLYAEMLGQAIREGCAVFDFGRSTIDAGTHRFKQQWGAKPVPLTWEYWLPEGGRLPQLRPDAPKFRLAVRAWQRLPLAVANWLGPAIVKNLP